MKGQEKYYTTKEAARELSVTPGRVRQMVVDKVLEAEKFGRDLMISETEIAAARKRKTKPGPVKTPQRRGSKSSRKPSAK
jgi:excisionase family DNA binding protein